MADEIEELCGRISLTDGEKECIMITEGEVADLADKGSRCLVGRLVTEKRFNREAFRCLLTRLWRPVGRIIFKEIQENLWVFEFFESDDMRRVLEGRPWSFERYILVLNNFMGSVPPSQMAFTQSPFWVQIHDIPLLCMNKEVGFKIGYSLGEFVAVDVAGNGGGWGHNLRICIILDLSKLLEHVCAPHVGGDQLLGIF